MDCYDCGRRIPVGEVYRRNVQVGNSVGFGAGGQGWLTVREERVSLCFNCNSVRVERARRAANSRALFLLSLVIGSLGLWVWSQFMDSFSGRRLTQSTGASSNSIRSRQVISSGAYLSHPVAPVHSQTSLVNQAQNISSADTSPPSFRFPQESCGDPSGLGSNWWPVFVNHLDQSAARSAYCRDAISVTREDGRASVQLASFSSRLRAEQFSVVVSGEVGEPYIFNRAETQQPEPLVSTPMIQQIQPSNLSTPTIHPLTPELVQNNSQAESEQVSNTNLDPNHLMSQGQMALERGDCVSAINYFRDASDQYLRQRDDRNYWRAMESIERCPR